MLRRSFLVLTILVATVVISFYGGSVLAHTPSPPICNDPICNIDVLDNSFQPQSVTIRPPNPTTGENVTVVWQNHGLFTHTVTSGVRGGPDGIFNQVLSSGDVFQLEINQSMYNQLISRYPSGVVPYYCSIHFGMDATLTIAGEPIPEFSLPTFFLTMTVMSVMLFRVFVRSRGRGSKST